MTSTKYTVRGTFAFVEEIVEQDSELFMGILDVDSFYTKIPNQETINICTNTLFEEQKVYQKKKLISRYQRIIFYFEWKTLQTSRWSRYAFTVRFDINYFFSCILLKELITKMSI